MKTWLIVLLLGFAAVAVAFVVHRQQQSAKNASNVPTQRAIESPTSQGTKAMNEAIQTVQKVQQKVQN